MKLTCFIKAWAALPGIFKECPILAEGIAGDLARDVLCCAVRSALSFVLLCPRPVFPFPSLLPPLCLVPTPVFGFGWSLFLSHRVRFPSYSVVQGRATGFCTEEELLFHTGVRSVKPGRV